MAREIHKERLATTDETGKRIFLFPEEVKGFFRKYRNYVYWILIFIFLGTPWLNIDGKQSILFDIPKRELTFFGLTFLGHDTPLVFFVFTIAALFIAAITAVFGRVWCGWACPQTVFIDAVYRKIEELIEGNARARRDLERENWSAKKFFKRSLKWTLFLILSMHLAHTFLGYFVGIRNLFAITTTDPRENWSAFITMLTTTGILLFNFGWFREQFCIIACPYGRFQSVMMDSQSLVVAYDYKRGEPRRSSEIEKKDEGDCISCAKCVKVCPTGIDIRRGTQLECIACTACIDACDEIMLKVGKPKGLIRYTSEEMVEGKEWKLLRPRPLIYFSLLIVLSGIFIYLVSNREDLSAVYTRGTSSPYTLSKDDQGNEIVVNYYKILLNYRPLTETHADFSLPKEWDRKISITSAKRPFLVKHGQSSVGIFLKFSPSLLKNGNLTIPISISFSGKISDEKKVNTQEIHLVGP